MSGYILDSSAILSVVYKEPGIDIVRSVLPKSAISSVNLCEAVGNMTSGGSDPDQSLEDLIGLVPDVIAFDTNLAFVAARMLPATKPFGLSLGDRACLATAITMQLEVLTADKIWGKLKLPIKIRVIR